MSMDNQQLQKLIASARKAYAPPTSPPDESPSLGFATRIAARWSATHRHPARGDVLERFCWWGASVSVGVCVVAFAQQALSPEPNVFELVLEIQATAPELL